MGLLHPSHSCIHLSYFTSKCRVCSLIGIGTAGAVLLNMFLFGESKSKARIISVALIVCGVTGLKALS